MNPKRPWRRFFRRSTVAVLVAVVLVLAPCPVWTPDIFTWWQVPVVLVVLICYLGAALYDTLFFDRYQ